MIAAIHGILEQGTFSPRSIDAMSMWYSSDIGVTKDGSNKVSAWADRSGNGWHLSQSNATYQPTYLDAAIGGVPGIRFNGHQLASASQTMGAREYVIVYNLQGAPASDYHTLIIQDASPFYQILIRAGAVRFYVDPTEIGTSASSTTGVNYLLFIRGTENTAANAVKQNASLGNLASAIPSTPNVAAPFKIGSFGTNTNPLNGDIAEVMVFNRALTNTERNNLEAHLKSKYSLSY